MRSRQTPLVHRRGGADQGDRLDALRLGERQLHRDHAAEEMPAMAARSMPARYPCRGGDVIAASTRSV